MLEAKNVVKTFDGFRALDGATLTAPSGRTARASPRSSAI